MVEMKDSGIEWIGKIPKTWKVEQISKIYRERNEKVSDKNFQPLSVTKKGILHQLENVAKTDNGDNRKLVLSGDFVINSRSDRRGSCGISPYNGSVSLINTVLEPYGDINDRYYNYVFKSERFADEFYKWGHGIVDDLWSTKWNDMKRICIPYPSIEEQEKVSNYLDLKTNIIDDTISKTKETIEDYEKYKLSLITEVITGGLDKKIEMKNSEIKWIGDIPKNWDVVPLKKECFYQEGPGIMAKDFREYGVPLIRISGVKGNNVSLEGCNYLDPEMVKIKWNHFRLDKDDIVVSASSSTGIVSIVNDDNVVGAIPYTGLIRFKVGSRLLTKYLVYFISSNVFLEQINIQKTGATIQHYGPTHLSNVKILLPSKDEQKLIVQYLDKKCLEIDNLISSKQKLITELEDYKKSLIYECVTGKKEI